MLMCLKQFVYIITVSSTVQKDSGEGGVRAGMEIGASCSATTVCCLVARTSEATCQASNSLRLPVNEILNNHIIHKL